MRLSDSLNVVNPLADSHLGGFLPCHYHSWQRVPLPNRQPGSPVPWGAGQEVRAVGLEVCE